MPASPDGGGGGGGGGGADATDDVEEVIVCLSQCPEGLPRGGASIEIRPKVHCPD